MSTLKRRLDSIEERLVLQQHRDLQRQFKGRSGEELSFFAIHGYWPESAGDTLPPGTEFTVRGIKTVVNTQWEDKDQQNG